MTQSLSPLEMIESSGSIIHDQHFVYASDEHGSDYVDCDRLYRHPEMVRALLTPMLSPHVANIVPLPGYEVIAAPATGGVYLVGIAGLLAHTTSHPVKTVWADKIGNKKFAFERAGFAECLDGANVLIVDDVLTTGSSVAKVARLVESAGGTVVAVRALVNRGQVTAQDMQVPDLYSRVCVDYPAVPADKCQLCIEEVPIVTNLGHPGSFLNERPDYPTKLYLGLRLRGVR